MARVLWWLYSAVRGIVDLVVAVVTIVVVAILVVLGLACAPPEAPKTAESMRWHRLHDNGNCTRMCPIGSAVEPLLDGSGFSGPADWCCDPEGLAWSSCAWNTSGRYQTLADLTDPARIAAMHDCGPGSDWPNCTDHNDHNDAPRGRVVEVPR